MSKLSEAREGGENLPPDCWQLIFNYLNERDLETVSLVCKDFLTNSNLVKESLNVHPKPEMLSRHLKRFTQLKNVDLSYFEGDLEEALCEIARSDVSLESLCIYWQYAPFKTEGLRALASNPKMRNLKALTSIPLIALPLIANWFPNLEELDIRDWYDPQDDTPPADLPPDFAADVGIEIECLASKLKYLKRISIFGLHTSVFDQCLVALSGNCVYLTDVSVTGVKESCIGLLIRNRPHLEALSISEIDNDPSSTITIANSIGHAKALTSLEFMDMKISDELLMAIAKAKLRLKNFGIRDCINYFTVTGLLLILSNYLTQLTIQGAKFVDEEIKLLCSGDVGNLTHIVLCGRRVTNSTLFLLLSKCPSLVEFSIALYEPLNDTDYSISLSKYHKIRYLHLTNWTISEELAKQFGLIFPNVEVLDLHFLEGGEYIEAILKSCKYITQLKLEAYRFAKIIEANSELPEVNLEVLSLQFSDIDDEGLAVIGTKCPQLVDLDLSYCKKVTTKSIKKIVQNIKTLTYLDLWCCDRIDDGDLLEWMLSTGNFASLKGLYLGRVYFTEEQRDQFLHHGCLLI